MSQLLRGRGKFTLVVFVLAVQGIRDPGKSSVDAFLLESSLIIIFFAGTPGPLRRALLRSQR